jgi:hypothetical protein
LVYFKILSWNISGSVKKKKNTQNLRITSELAKIRPGYLGSKIPEGYRYTHLLGKTQITLKKSVIRYLIKPIRETKCN